MQITYFPGVYQCLRNLQLLLLWIQLPSHVVAHVYQKTKDLVHFPVVAISSLHHNYKLLLNPSCQAPLPIDQSISNGSKHKLYIIINCGWTCIFDKIYFQYFWVGRWGLKTNADLSQVMEGQKFALYNFFHQRLKP